jgi:putative DNA primase/helicase
MTPRPVPLAVQPKNIPAELIAADQFVVWRYELDKDNHWTKPPYVASDPARLASSTDAETWRPFRVAFDAYEDGKCDGLGVPMGDDKSGVDLDHCIDDAGTIAPWAMAIVQAMNSYTERSPSGRGLRIFVRGSLPPGRRKAGDVEMYDSGRYLTVTGQHLAGTPTTIEERTAELAALHASTFPTNGNGTARPSPPQPSAPLDLDDAALLDKARAARNGAKFSTLWAGDPSGHASHSEADQALCNLLAFWTGADAGRMDALFRQSGQMREKWDARRGAQTYGERTVETAIAGCRETYTGPRPPSLCVAEPMPDAEAARDLVARGYGEAQGAAGGTTGNPDTSGQASTERGQGAAPPAPRRWQRAADAIAEPTPEPVLEGIAWADALSVVVGESTAGKTFLLLDMAAAVSANTSWHGRAVRHGSVVYFGFEGHVGLRLRALREVAGHWLEHVYVIRASDPLSPTIDRDRVEIPGRGELDAVRDLDDIVAHVTAEHLPPVALVEVDTVRASLSGSEDSSEAAAAYLRAVRRIMAHAPGAACLLAHHAGWQDGETRRKRERGSSAFRGNVDGTFYLEADEYDRERRQARLTLSTVKVRDGETLPPLYMVRKQVEIPGLADRWGHPVTSCIIVPDQRSREDREAEQTAAVDAQTRALDMKALRVIADRPDLTSQEGIRLALGVARPVVGPSLARLVTRGWVLPPASQRRPYTVTATGLAALQEATSCT